MSESKPPVLHFVEKLFGASPAYVAYLTARGLEHYLGKPSIGQIAHSSIDNAGLTLTLGLTDSVHKEIYPESYEFPLNPTQEDWFSRPVSDTESAGLGYEFVVIHDQEEPHDYAVHLLSWLVKQQLLLECDYAHFLRRNGCVTSGPYASEYTKDGKEAYYIVFIPPEEKFLNLQLNGTYMHFAVVSTIHPSDVEIFDEVNNDRESLNRLLKASFDMSCATDKRSYLS